MPRTREFNPDQVLDAALNLFWSKGYDACSMADVVKQSGVARYGLYQTFNDKNQLYYATLRRYHNYLHELYVRPLRGKRAGFKALIEHFNRMLEQLESNGRGGCFAHQAAIERGSKDDTVREIVDSIFNDTKKVYRRFIENAIEDGDIRTLPVEDLVNYVMGVQRALIAMTKQRCDVHERQNYVRCALHLLEPG